MRSPRSTRKTPLKWKVVLDGRDLSGLPDLPASPTELRRYLEILAWRERRVLATFRIEEAPSDAKIAASTEAIYGYVSARTLSLERWTERQGLWIQSELEAYRKRVEDAVIRVLLTEPFQVMEIWSELRSALVRKVLAVRFLQETGSILQTQSLVKPAWFERHLGRLQEVMKDADQVLQTGQAIPFSDFLEYELLPWLDSLQRRFLADKGGHES